MRRYFPVLVLLAATAQGCSSKSSSAPSPNATNIVFNELSAAGDEWLELYNGGDTEFDLGAYGLTDTDKDTGDARITKAMRFPSGTKLPSAGFLLVLMGEDTSTSGPYPASACLPDVPVGCFYGSFSVSEARGEAVHLLAPDSTVLSSTTYPADLDFEAGSGMTACRLPDGTGELTTCAASPGASNAAP